MAKTKKGQEPVRAHTPKAKAKNAAAAKIKRQRRVPGNLTPEKAARDLELKEGDADHVRGGEGWVNAGGWVNRVGGWLNSGGSWINRR